MRDPFNYLHLPPLDVIDNEAETPSQLLLQNVPAERIGAMLQALHVGAEARADSAEPEAGSSYYHFTLGERTVIYSLKKTAYEDGVTAVTTHLDAWEPRKLLRAKLKHTQTTIPFSPLTTSGTLHHHVVNAGLYALSTHTKKPSFFAGLSDDKAAWSMRIHRRDSPDVTRLSNPSSKATMRLTQAAILLAEVVEQLKTPNA